MSNFKHHERQTAKLLGGTRNVDGKGGAAVDVLHDDFSIECKSRKALPMWLTHGMIQARLAARVEQLPIVVLHEHGTRYRDDLVVLRMCDFVSWFGEVGEVEVEQ